MFNPKETKPMKRMNKLSLLTAIIVMVFIGTTNAGNEKGIKFHHMSLEQAMAKAKKENKNIFIDIYATWCGPCKHLTKNVFPDKELGEFMNENFICLKLDGEKADGESLMYKHNLGAYPTMLFLSPEGEQLHKIEGATSAEVIQSEAGYALDPTTHPLYEGKQKFKNGERDREFLGDLIIEMAQADQDPQEVVDAFVQEYPKLNLEEEKELVVLALAGFSIENGNYKNFITKINTLKATNERLCGIIMDNFLEGIATFAIENKDKSAITKYVNLSYNSYKALYKDESLEKSDLLQILNGMYDDTTEEME